MIHIAIIGTGDHAHGLAHLFSLFNTSPDAYRVEVTKPGLASVGTFHETGVPLGTFRESLELADIVILAIPAKALASFADDHLEALRDKVIVDATNSSVRGEDISSILVHTSIQWVKAFNDIGATDVLLEKPTSKHQIPVKMCSKYPDALALVQHFATESLGMQVKIIPYQHYGQIAIHQGSLGEHWTKSTIVLLIIFSLAETYAVVRYNVFKGYEWFHLPIQVTNKAICWTSIYGFALSQTPGILARLWNSIHQDSLRSKPSWLVKSLKVRKPLGILSLWFLVIHIIMSILIFNEKYYGKFFIDPTAASSKLNSIGESSMMFSILGAGLYFILGVCSLPSVGSYMTSAQWQFVYGPVAWIALAFGTIHVLIMGVKGWTTAEKWPGGMPPITMTSTLLPLLVLGLKLVQMVVCRFLDCSKWIGTVLRQNNDKKKYRDEETTYDWDESS